MGVGLGAAAEAVPRAGPVPAIRALFPQEPRNRGSSSALLPSERRRTLGPNADQSCYSRNERHAIGRKIPGVINIAKKEASARLPGSHVWSNNSCGIAVIVE